MTLSELLDIPFPKDTEDFFVVCTSFMKEKEGPFNIEGDGYYFISDKDNVPINNKSINDLINLVHTFDRDDDIFYKVSKVLKYWEEM